MNVKADDGSVMVQEGRIFLNPHSMTEAQLANLGIEEIAYVRPVMTPNGPAFGVFAANGTPMAIAPDNSIARAAIVQNEMAPVSVH